MSALHTSDPKFLNQSELSILNPWMEDWYTQDRNFKSRMTKSHLQYFKIL